jgi:hypothetical protein
MIRTQKGAGHGGKNQISVFVDPKVLIDHIDRLPTQGFCDAFDIFGFDARTQGFAASGTSKAVDARTVCIMKLMHKVVHAFQPFFVFFKKAFPRRCCFGSQGGQQVVVGRFDHANEIEGLSKKRPLQHHVGTA